MIAKYNEPPFRPRFLLGHVVATPGALAALTASGQTPDEFLDRHISGDWGDLCAEDQQANEVAIQDGNRILSAYTLRSQVKIWIITEAGFSSTALLLPSEY